MTYNLTNIKTSRSHNGYAMSCLFLIDGITVANFVDKGDGSEPTFYGNPNDTAKKLMAEFENKLAGLPEIYMPDYGMDLKIDRSLFIDLLHAAIVNKTEFKLLAA